MGFSLAQNPLGYMGINTDQQPPFLNNMSRVPTTKDVYIAGTQWEYVNGGTSTIYETTGAGNWLVGKRRC